MLCVGLYAEAEDRKYDLIVAQDGSGNYTTVQEAINAVPDYRKAGETRILIRKGVYKEKIVIAASKQMVHLVGEDGAVLTYDDYASKPNIFGENKGPRGSGSIYICPEGWNNWGKADNERTAYYAEYKSTGKGANAKKRASWSHQLSNIDEYDIHEVLKGQDGWDPTEITK